MIPNLDKLDFGGIDILKPKKYPQFNVLYADGGAGKTTIGSLADAPVIIPIHRETGHQKFANAGVPCFSQPEGMRPIDFVFAAIAKLLKTEHSRKTAVFDNLGSFREAVDEDVETDNAGQDLKAFGRKQALAYEYYTRLLAGFDMLMKKKGMDILLLAHSVPVNINLPDGSYFQQTRIHAQRGDNTNVGALLEARTHNVFYLKAEVQTKKTKGPMGQEKIIATRGDTVRTIYTKPSGTWFAKSRADLEDFYTISDDKSIKQFWGDVKNDISKEMEHEG